MALASVGTPPPLSLFMTGPVLTNYAKVLKAFEVVLKNFVSLHWHDRIHLLSLTLLKCDLEFCS